MGDYQSGRTSVTGSVQAASLPSGATAVNKAIYHAYGGAGSFDIYTPSSAVLYITELTFASSAVITPKIGDNVAGSIVADTVYDQAIMFYCAANNTITFRFSQPLVIATKLNMYNPTGAAGVYITFSGYTVPV